MRPWLFALGGLIVWTAHFLGVYAIASVADITPGAGWGWRAVTVAFSAACLAAAGALMIVALRRRPAQGDSSHLLKGLAVGGAALAMIAIAWQTLPALISP